MTIIDVFLYCRFCFFFKQKTAYELRISDWSSDVCSSDLPEAEQAVVAAADAQALIADADGKGFARANARMTTVFASDEGKASPSLAAFMLANSQAEAPAIIEQLKAPGDRKSVV